MENTTRIADLPDSAPQNYIPPAIETRQQNNANVPTNYVPINVHPNPYGISAQNPIPPTPQPTHTLQPTQQPQQHQQPQYISEEQHRQLQNMQHQRLPSRDIPRDTTDYTHDDAIQANYIPKNRVEKDYVREYEDMTERNLREYEDKKRKEKSMDNLINQLQIPIMIALMYLVFQLPIINTIIFKRFSMFAIYDNDGNFNFYGLLFKSALFGWVYYMIQYMTNFLSEL
jgi:hypothetical protein|uniref:Uncharacterized protein n=1 Tax=viral metagenome TaxID=1070528 RepID=A0A6C0H2Z5_9ZZZZ